MQLSFTTVTVSEQDKPVLAEQLLFDELASFFYADLCRGMAAGNLPRRCRNCQRFFLVIGAYDTIYCDKVAPGEKRRTCRQVGAHRKETRLNGTDSIRKEYQRVYNRLKARKRSGALSVNDCNAQVAQLRELKTAAVRGELRDTELKKRFDAF